MTIGGCVPLSRMPRSMSVGPDRRKPRVDVRLAEPEAVGCEPVARDVAAAPPPEHRFCRDTDELGNLARREKPVRHGRTPSSHFNADTNTCTLGE